MSMSIDYEAKRLTMEWVAGECGLVAANGAGYAFAVDPLFEGLGSSTLTVAYATDGGALFSTDATDGEGIFIVPQLGGTFAPWETVTWGTDDEIEWECTLKVGDIDSSIAWVGLKLTDTDVVATDADQAFFRTEDDVSSASWVAQCSVNDSDLSHVSDNIVIDNEIVRFGVKFDKDEVCHMYINGREVFSRSFKGNTVDLKPYIGIEADGAADAVTATVYGQKISRILK
jgi:hypothetical protein